MDYSWTIYGYTLNQKWHWTFSRNRGVAGKIIERNGGLSSHVAIACHRPAKSLLGPWRILVTMPSQKEVEDLASCSVDPSSVEEKQNLADGAHEIPFLYQYNSYIYISYIKLIKIGYIQMNQMIYPKAKKP